MLCTTITASPAAPVPAVALLQAAAAAVVVAQTARTRKTAVIATAAVERSANTSIATGTSMVVKTAGNDITERRIRRVSTIRVLVENV